MSDNKFIERLKGKNTNKSVLEIKNEATKASFANMPSGTSNAIDVYSDHRGDATAVLNGTINWKISDNNLILANDVAGNGQDFDSIYSVSGAGLWVDSVYTFPSTGDPLHPIAMVFNPTTKWVLKVCGDNFIVDGGSIAEFTLLIKIGTSNIFTKQFSIKEQAGQFCKEFVLDFNETNAGIIKASGLTTLTVQLLCGTANASARIYNGMTVLTCLQRKVDASAVSTSFANVEEALQDGMLPSDYFNNAAFIDEVTDGEEAYAVFQRDGDTINLSGWTPKDAVAYKDEVIIKAEVMPTPNADLVGAIYQYTGITSAPYQHGYIYECSEISPGVYSWERIDVQPGGSRGRFLALWNCATGLAESDPPISPYEYRTGDYFVVGTVSNTTNYKPDGSSYVIGQASTTVETNEIAVDDTYFFDGTQWKLQSNSNKTVSFSAIAGDIYDNASATTALNAKQNTITGAATTITTNNLTASKAVISNASGKIDVSATTSRELGYLSGVRSAVQTQIDRKQATLVSGTNIKTINSGSILGSGNIDVLVNEATATNALGVGYTTINTTYNDSINIGNASQVLANNAIALGAFASAEGQDSIAIYSSTGTSHRARTTHTGNIAIGYNALAINAAYTIAIGYNAFAQGTNSIQLGTGNVASQNTFQVWTYPMLNKTTGLIPAARFADQTSATQGQVLTLDANLDAEWKTISTMTGASAGDAGASGLVPAPAAGDQAKFLQGDGTWANPTAAIAWGNITGTLSHQTDLQNALNAKQNTLTAGTNINITGSTISATDTTYTGSDGVTLTGTNFTNSGVRAVATGTTSGTVSVNTNGTSTDVAVNGWANKADAATTLAGYGITDGANTNLSNLTSAGKNVCANIAMPGDNYDNLTLGASGNSYTAPADGYFYVNKTTNANNQQVVMINESAGSGMRTYCYCNLGSGNWVTAWIPAAKGQTIRITYNAGGTTNTFQFIYANGAS